MRAEYYAPFGLEAFLYKAGAYYDPVGDEIFILESRGFAPCGTGETIPVFNVHFEDEVKAGAVISNGQEVYLGKV